MHNTVDALCLERRVVVSTNSFVIQARTSNRSCQMFDSYSRRIPTEMWILQQNSNLEISSPGRHQRTDEKWEICLALLHNLVHHFCSQQIFAFVQFRRAFRCVYLIWCSCTSSSSCTFYSGTKLTFTMTRQWCQRALTVPDFCQTSQAPEIFRKMHFWRFGSVGSTATSYVTALTTQYLQQCISISIHLLILRAIECASVDSMQRQRQSSLRLWTSHYSLELHMRIGMFFVVLPDQSALFTWLSVPAPE